MKLKPVLCALLVACGASAQAAPVTWTLSGVTFNDQSVATGSFVFDASLSQYLSWDITTTTTVDFNANHSSQNGVEYTTNSLTNASISYYLNPSSLGVKQSSATTFGLVYATPLTDAGGTVLLGGKSGKGYEFNGFNSRTIVSGAVIAAPVPEPQTCALMLAGLGMVAFALRRQAKT
ncbi:hypothetical protein BH11PSE8_BH11PSE8_36890 [soil metagenome]